MDVPGSRDARFNLSYNMGMLSGETQPEIYGNLGRPGTSLQQMSQRGGPMSAQCQSRGMKSSPSDMCYEVPTSQTLGLDPLGVQDVSDDTYGNLQAKKSPPSNGKKTKGRVKIKMEYIENKLRRYTTFSKRKTGIMKKAYELSTLTGTQVMLLVASETGHVYTFATRKLQPMITSEAGKALIQTCLNSPDPLVSSSGLGGDQRMSATGFEETELTYNISDEDSKEDEMSVADSSGESSGPDSPGPAEPEQNTNPPPPPPPLPPPSLQDKSHQRISSTSTVSSSSSSSSISTSNEKRSNITRPQQSLVGPLLYQVPQGVVSNGVIFSLAQGTDPQQFITIPLSVAMAATNGHNHQQHQTELDLSKRK